MDTKEQKMKQNLAFTSDMDIRKNDSNDNVVMDLTYKRVQWDMFPEGEKASNYDSNDSLKKSTGEGQLAAMGKVFGSMVNVTFHCEMEKTGEVVSVKGTDMLVDKIFAAMMPAGIDPEKAAMMEGFKETFKEQYSEETFKKSFNQMFNFLPGKKVKINESWTGQNVIDVTGVKTTINNVYTLKEVKGDVAVITLVSEAVKDEESNTSGTQTGTIEVDMKTGLALKSEILQDLVIIQDLGGGPTPIHVKGKILVTTTKK
jgi:hypothetical protein